MNFSLQLSVSRLFFQRNKMTYYFLLTAIITLHINSVTVVSLKTSLNESEIQSRNNTNSGRQTSADLLNLSSFPDFHLNSSAHPEFIFPETEVTFKKPSVKGESSKSHSTSLIENSGVPTVPNDKPMRMEGSPRGCPACEGGECDPMFDTKVNISGIPVIQIIIAIAVGAFWAGIFAFILHNFIVKDKKGGGYDVEGYGYGAPTPEYGIPDLQYGAPHSHSIKRTSNRLGRSSQSNSLNFSNLVWSAIDKLADLYDK